MRTLLLASLLLLNTAGFGEEWSRFRGANGGGVASGSGYPEALRKAVWRTPVRAGKSSPVLTEGHIFLTGFADGKLYTQCFDRQTGSEDLRHDGEPAEPRGGDLFGG
jgi:outer membrane protein assembly factor BamB